MSLREKARENLQVAQDAFADKRHSAAASRLYYSLYQAVVYELEAQDKTLESYNSELVAKRKAQNSTDDHWPHSTIRHACADILEQKEVRFLKEIQHQREIADYAPEPVEGATLKLLFPKIEPMLKALGVVA